MLGILLRGDCLIEHEKWPSFVAWASHLPQQRLCIRFRKMRFRTPARHRVFQVFLLERTTWRSNTWGRRSQLSRDIKRPEDNVLNESHLLHNSLVIVEWIRHIFRTSQHCSSVVCCQLWLMGRIRAKRAQHQLASRQRLAFWVFCTQNTTPLTHATSSRSVCCSPRILKPVANLYRYLWGFCGTISPRGQYEYAISNRSI
jgi:hypothetical protein